MTEAKKVAWANIILGLCGLVLIVLMGWAGMLQGSITREADTRLNEDNRLEQKMDTQQQRIEDKLDDIQLYIMETD